MTAEENDKFIKNAKDFIATEEDNVDVLKKKNQDLRELLERLIDMLKEKSNVCLNLEKQNTALNTQITSLKDVIAITKNLLNIRNTEIENLLNDLKSLQEKIKTEKDRHNEIIESISNAHKLNEDIKAEYQNQMNLFQKLREKYTEKLVLLSQENQKLRNELDNYKISTESKK